MDNLWQCNEPDASSGADREQTQANMGGDNAFDDSNLPYFVNPSFVDTSGSNTVGFGSFGTYAWPQQLLPLPDLQSSFSWDDYSYSQFFDAMGLDEQAFGWTDLAGVMQMPQPGTMNTGVDLQNIDPVLQQPVDLRPRATPQVSSRPKRKAAKSNVDNTPAKRVKSETPARVQSLQQQDGSSTSISPGIEQDIETRLRSALSAPETYPTTTTPAPSKVDRSKGASTSHAPPIANPMARYPYEKENLPANLSPDEILANHADQLYGNNLLRAAAWTRNTDIAEVIGRTSADPSGQLKKGARDVSAPRKRIIEACKALGKKLGVSEKVVTDIFDDLRKQNVVPGVKGGKTLEGAWMEEKRRVVGIVEMALHRIMSGLDPLETPALDGTYVEPPKHVREYLEDLCEGNYLLLSLTGHGAPAGDLSIIDPTDDVNASFTMRTPGAQVVAQMIEDAKSAGHSVKRAFPCDPVNLVEDATLLYHSLPYHSMATSEDAGHLGIDHSDNTPRLTPDRGCTPWHRDDTPVTP